jgi:hypothetical protein
MQTNNINEDMSQKNITQKDQIQELIAKYIPPHLRKVDKIQVPRKEEREPTTPPITRTRKSQPKTLKLKGIVKIEM